MNLVGYVLDRYSRFLFIILLMNTFIMNSISITRFYKIYESVSSIKYKLDKIPAVNGKTSIFSYNSIRFQKIQ